jgi:hypothetical protein
MSSSSPQALLSNPYNYTEHKAIGNGLDSSFSDFGARGAFDDSKRRITEDSFYPEV